MSSRSEERPCPSRAGRPADGDLASGGATFEEDGPHATIHIVRAGLSEHSIDGLSALLPGSPVSTPSASDRYIRFPGRLCR